MSIADNLKQVLAELPQGVRLVAVSKFHPNEAIEEAYQAGQRIFGESKVQEMTAKYESLPKDIEWHFIGHLQTNKIKYMIPYVAMIHGIDSYKLTGVKNNISYLRAIMDTPDFVEGHYDTGFITKNGEHLQQCIMRTSERAENIAMIAAYMDYLMNLEENRGDATDNRPISKDRKSVV